jgi:3-hydroxyisobutyrate dehydrogenase
MGSGMASRLLSQGFDVAVYNRSPQKTEALRLLGATVHQTPREAADGAEFIISMLADDAAAKKVWLGTGGALEGAMRGAVLIESSTVTVDWVKELANAAALADRRLDFLDAPVTGSRNHAAAGELTFLVGGGETTLSHARPFLSAMSKDIIHLGPVGSGALMKLINNFVCGVQAVALAEAVAAIERSDLNLGKAVGVLAGGAPGSPLVKMISARMMAKNYDPNFTLKLITKDLRYAAREAGPCAVGDAAIATFQRAIDVGMGEMDFSAVVELLRKPTGGN